jgi:hypothetical protein
MDSNRSVALVIATLCLACASVGRIGDEIHIADEGAIIIWDEDSKTQHFIRRASFRTRAKDFGFLVPTPTVPKLAEASDLAFTHLEKITTVPSLTKGVEAAAAASKASVVVIERAQVAGLDAAVLKASDPGALGAWLKANGYTSTPELMEWAAHYIEKRWIITAFKIAAVQDAHQLDASAVRMSFQTEQPFFPYREPAQASVTGSRALRVYFLSTGRVDGTIGAAGAWPGRTMQSFELSDSDLDRLKELLKLPSLRTDLRRLTFLFDHSSPRPGREDLFFSRAADQSVVTPVHLAERSLERISREAEEKPYDLMKRKEQEERERREAYILQQQKDEARRGEEERQAIAPRSSAESALWIVLIAIAVTGGIAFLRMRRRKDS